MELSPFGVRATSGSLRAAQGTVLAHAWTEAGIAVGPATNGAQLFHLSVAVCVLNDTFREARRLGVEVGGVAVEVDGGFDAEWRSTGVEYAVAVDSSASEDELARLHAAVDAVAEVPRAIRAGAPVSRR